MSVSLRPDGTALFEGLPAGFAAGFTTRRIHPDGRETREGERHLARALGARDATVVRIRQVHGAVVLVADGSCSGVQHVVAGEADGVATRESGLVLAISTADCVPLLLLDEASGWIAAIHAGWRGTAARIVDAALDLLAAEGAPPGALRAYVGPSISRDRYEVGPEVVEAVRGAIPGGADPPAAVRPGRDDRSWLDVAAFVRAALERRGVAGERIVDPGLCTAGDPARFPSYRRDGRGTGRILTGIVRLPPSGPG